MAISICSSITLVSLYLLANEKTINTLFAVTSFIRSSRRAFNVSITDASMGSG